MKLVPFALLLLAFTYSNAQTTNKPANTNTADEKDL